MKKTASKAKQQQHHSGSSSAAPKVIVVDVDSKALDCPRCLLPLVPPVFQCAAGHVVCSTCHRNLPDKNKCTSCFIKIGHNRCLTPTRYSRCLALERVVRSVRVACPNAFYGCTAGKMLYHEKEEHDKTCAVIAGSSSLPRWVVKMGPCGGGGGNAWEMDVRNVDRIIKVIVWRRNFVFDAMSVLYDGDGQWESTKHGRAGGERSEICLESDEYLTGMKGHVGDYDGRFVVKSLTFVTNQRTFGPYGDEEGAPFELPAAGGRIVGFHGRSDSYLNALGTYVKMDA